MKNYVYTFKKRTFEFKFSGKNASTETKKFIYDVLKKKYNIKIFETKPDFIVEFNEKKTLADLKNDINKLIQNFKKTNYVNIQYENIHSETSQIASLVTNFNLPDLNFPDLNNNEDSENSLKNKSEETSEKNEISEENKKIINEIVIDFLNIFKKHIKKNILTNYSDEKIENMILSFSYQYHMKKLIITIPLEVYDDIVIEYLKIHNFDLKNIDKTNKVLNSDSLIILNYNNITCYFLEFMNLCNLCKSYHRLFDKNNSTNEFLKLCMEICTKCGSIENKTTKKAEHKCTNKENIDTQNCVVCKFYYKENFEHEYKTKNCNHSKNKLKDFITSNRINSIENFNKNTKKENKNFTLKKEEYPILIKEKISEKILEKNEVSETVSMVSTTSSNFDDTEDFEGTFHLKDFKEDKKKTSNNKIGTLKKINNIHNYEIEIIDEENIKKEDVVNINIYINNVLYVFKTEIK